MLEMLLIDYKNNVGFDSPRVDGVQIKQIVVIKHYVARRFQGASCAPNIDVS
jgi:hypothetical protein